LKTEIDTEVSKITEGLKKCTSQVVGDTQKIMDELKKLQIRDSEYIQKIIVENEKTMSEEKMIYFLCGVLTFFLHNPIGVLLTFIFIVFCTIT